MLLPRKIRYIFNSGVPTGLGLLGIAERSAYSPDSVFVKAIKNQLKEYGMPLKWSTGAGVFSMSPKTSKRQIARYLTLARKNPAVMPNLTVSNKWGTAYAKAMPDYKLSSTMSGNIYGGKDKFTASVPSAFMHELGHLKTLKEDAIVVDPFYSFDQNASLFAAFNRKALPAFLAGALGRANTLKKEFIATQDGFRALRSVPEASFRDYFAYLGSNIPAYSTYVAAASSF